MKYKNTDVDIRDVQKIALDILIEFDRICKKNNINYQLFAGTLLGAIRHNGFIPWDDDIDVCMLRKDYERFLSVCEKDLQPEFFLQTCFTDPKSVVQFAKIRRNDTIFENDVDCSPQSSHTGIYIDIFPMDNVEPDSLVGKWQPIKFSILYAILSSSVIERVRLCKSLPKKILRYCFCYLLKVIPKSFIDKQAQKALRMFENETTEYVSHLSNGSSKKRYYRFLRKAEHFNNTVNWGFEGHTFPVPEDYDEVLTNLYGDYMLLPPEEDRYPHHGIKKVKLI